MRIIVISDSHGDKYAVKKIIDRNLGHADIFVHLGDGEKEMTQIMDEYPFLDFRCVAGNCDYMGNFLKQLVIDVDGARIFCAHGHMHFVKHSTITIRSIAKDNDCNVVLFGHTHCQLSTYQEGIHIMNPGSCAAPRDGNPPSYGYIDITKNGIVTNIVTL